MPTIRDVARLANVSPTTASDALNNRPKVKEETRQVVLWAAKQLNYVPNKLAQSIRNGKTNTIMVLTSENIECGNTFSSEFLGVLAGARAFNYDVLVKLIDSNTKSEEEIFNLIGNSICDGYLLLGNHLDSVAQVLVKQKSKCVMLSSHSDVPILQVNSDGRKWIRLMTEQVIQRGKHAPAYFCFDEITEEEQLRSLGYQEAISAMLPDFKPSVFECGTNGIRIEENLKHVLRDGFDAIICWNDVLAMQVVEVLTALGFDIPQQIAVTGFDDSLAYPNPRYQLTTVHQDFQLKGRVAVQKLIEQITSGVAAAEKLFVDCSIIERDTL